MLVTEDNQEVTLEDIPCIQYPVQFQKDKNGIQVLLDLGSKVNAMNSAYNKKLRFRVRQSDVVAHKIDKSYLDTFGMVIAGFSFQDKLEKV